MKRVTAQATPFDNEQDLITCRLMVISRYVDDIRTLSRLAERLGHVELGTAMVEVALGMERLSYDIATSETGTLVLRRAAKLIGTVDGVLAMKARRAILH